MLVDTAIRKSVNMPPYREMKIGCGQRSLGRGRIISVCVNGFFCLPCVHLLFLFRHL